MLANMQASAQPGPAQLMDLFGNSRSKSRSEREFRDFHALIECAITSVRKARGVQCQVIARGTAGSCALAIDGDQLLRGLALLILAAAHVQPGPVRLITHLSAAGAEIGISGAGANLNPAALEHSAANCEISELLRAASALVQSQGGQLLLRAAGAARMHTVLVRFPAERTRKAGGGSIELPPKARAPDPGRVDATHVMLVEDDPDALEFLTLILRQAGARVSPFGLAEPALQFHTGTEAADVIVSDIAMPRQDGHSLMRHVRAWERSHGRVPIPAIAVSAFGRDEDLRRSIASGFDRHLAKPIDAGELIEEIGHWIPALP